MVKAVGWENSYTTQKHEWEGAENVWGLKTQQPPSFVKTILHDGAIIQ